MNYGIGSIGSIFWLYLHIAVKVQRVLHFGPAAESIDILIVLFFSCICILDTQIKYIENVLYDQLLGLIYEQHPKHRCTSAWKYVDTLKNTFWQLSDAYFSKNRKCCWCSVYSKILSIKNAVYVYERVMENTLRRL